MRRSSAALGSTVFFLLAPGTVAVLVPWLLTGWQRGADLGAFRVLGWALVVVGGAGLVHAFVRFVRQGLGTPAPVAPPDHLVVTGVYRYVRNPMYLAVLSTIVGQALILGRVVLVGYALVIAIAMWAFVKLYEEPNLQRRFGAEYDAYRASVPGWVPRLPRPSGR
jgi:protein-S-isoprenylcysteine O-methyltransferase Ste14